MNAGTVFLIIIGTSALPSWWLLPALPALAQRRGVRQTDSRPRSSSPVAPSYRSCTRPEVNMNSVRMDIDRPAALR
jgi:hypothetical protein